MVSFYSVTIMAEFRHLVRIANTDLDGNKAVVYALKNIKGVSVPLANAICKVAGIDGLSKTGNLSEAQSKKLDGIVADPARAGIPSWMLNRRKDVETGEDKHLVTNQLIFTKENDIKQMRRIKSYRGVRHSLGLPVRGQRTRSNFRRNKGKVTGVKKKKK